MDDFVPALMREINTLYDVDCFYTNGWPPLGSLPDCHCAICSKLPRPNTTAYWRAFNDRLFALWAKYDAIAKEKKPDSFFFANLGGNVHCRTRPQPPRQNRRLVPGRQPGPHLRRPGNLGLHPAGAASARPSSTAKPPATSPRPTPLAPSPGATARRSPDELRMWFNESLAGGVVPYCHFVGGYEGFEVDRRWQKTGDDFFHWMAAHDPHFRVRRSLANIGVVMGQSTQLLYPGPTPGPESGREPGPAPHFRDYMRETTNGLYAQLLRGRYAFDFVHEDRLDPEHLRKYTALLLPNIAMLSDRQCRSAARLRRRRRLAPRQL